MIDYKIVIPARYASSRLPGKPLLKIAGKPMIQHTYERAKQCMAGDIVIATDDQRIADAASLFCSDIVMTAKEHRSGTERNGNKKVFISNCVNWLKWLKLNTGMIIALWLMCRVMNHWFQQIILN